MAHISQLVSAPRVAAGSEYQGGPRWVYTCQGIRYIHSMSYALLAITELPNNELTGIHTCDLPPLLL